jgi:hypothetical protein
MKLCPKLILEGTRLTHKTDIAFDKRHAHCRATQIPIPFTSSLPNGAGSPITLGRGLINFEAHEKPGHETYHLDELFQHCVLLDRRSLPHFPPNLSAQRKLTILPGLNRFCRSLGSAWFSATVQPNRLPRPGLKG